MTDAREIIESLLPISRLNDELRKSRAQHIIEALATAGIRFAGPDDRILGPDEVDPVTVEKCAEVADQIAPKSMGWNSYAAWVQRVANAIRSLGRKA